MQVAHQRDHVAVFVGEMLAQPFAEQVFDFERHPQHHVTGFGRAGVGGGVENAFDFRIVQRRNDRRHHHGGGHAGLRQRTDRL